MTTGLPAWVAICAVLAVQMLPAHAQPVPTGPTGEEAPPPDPSTDKKLQVAVIDLTEDDPNVRELSQELYAAINQSDEVMIPNRRGYDMFLTGRFVDEDSQWVGQAKNHLVSAKARVEEGDMASAASYASNGEKDLANAFPTLDTRELYSELALIDGLALLDEGRHEEAAWALSLAHRLDSTKTLDPASYPPDTINAFKKAIAAPTTQVTLELTGFHGRVWIDFVDRGEAPGKFDIEIGEHVITVTGNERLTTPILPTNKSATSEGRSPVVKRVATIEVPEAKAEDALQVQRARLALAKAQIAHDDVGRANAMNRIARLVDIGDAIMISKRADKKLQWETWRDRAPGFSAPKEWLVDQKPSEILDTIAPPHRAPPRQRFVPPPQNPPFVPPLAVEQQWYEKGWVQISGATVVILAVVGVILLATRDRPITFDGDVKVQQ